MSPHVPVPGTVFVRRGMCYVIVKFECFCTPFTSKEPTDTVCKVANLSNGAVVWSVDLCGNTTSVDVGRSGEKIAHRDSVGSEMSSDADPVCLDARSVLLDAFSVRFDRQTR